MRVVRQYVAFDGAMFSTRSACLEYEKEAKMIRLFQKEWDGFRQMNGPANFQQAYSFFARHFTLTPNERTLDAWKKLEARDHIADKAARHNYTLDPRKEK